MEVDDFRILVAVGVGDDDCDLEVANRVGRGPDRAVAFLVAQTASVAAPCERDRIGIVDFDYDSARPADKDGVTNGSVLQVLPLRIDRPRQTPRPVEGCRAAGVVRQLGIECVQESAVTTRSLPPVMTLTCEPYNPRSDGPTSLAFSSEWQDTHPR